ncbi:MAG: class I SAM-dependent methyltransferase [Candidatus Woesearchaeota archaeon]|nr:class I SAM-dependent methyltransferase [Candidatus Woesearchaeota archaeon]
MSKMKKVNQEADYYYKAYFSKLDPTHYFHKPKIDKILSLVPEKSSILDAGCGSGVLLYLLKQKKKCDICGVDIREECIDFASKKCKSRNFYKKDLRNFNLNKKFDVVTCLDVIEHFKKKERLAVLENLNKHLKKGGLLILAFPSKFYIEVVEKVWKIVRRTLHPKTTFDDEGIHDAVDDLEIKNFLFSKGYKLRKEGLSSFCLIKYLVFAK